MAYHSHLATVDETLSCKRVLTRNEWLEVYIDVDCRCFYLLADRRIGRSPGKSQIQDERQFPAPSRDLSLPGAGDRTAWAWSTSTEFSVSGSIVGGREGILARLKSSWGLDDVFQSSIGELGVEADGSVRDRLASSSLSRLLVGSQVEGDEEDQVGGQDAHAGESSEFLTGAFACTGHPFEVGGGEVGVGGEVNEAKINNKLSNLESGDPFLPPDTDTASGKEVVPVHHNMDEQVDGDWDPLHRGCSNELSIA